MLRFLSHACLVYLAFVSLKAMLASVEASPAVQDDNITLAATSSEYRVQPGSGFYEVTPKRVPQVAGQPPASSERHNAVVKVVNKSMESIVAVKVPRRGLNDLTASGVIVDSSGLVVTNRHVAAASDTVTVVMHDGRQLGGRVVHMNADTDLAFIRISTPGSYKALTPVPVHDLMPGETVIAVGHPYGYANTISTGIVSALGREIRLPTGDTLRGLIQTSAPINPGNSGGPLLNIDGGFIGINVAMREGAQCIAFAINADTIARELASVRR